MKIDQTVEPLELPWPLAPAGLPPMAPSHWAAGWIPPVHEPLVSNKNAVKAEAYTWID